jgi:thymidylate synthase (FAD)
MQIIEPSAHIADQINGKDLLKKIEVCGRVCYRSEDKITEDSAGRFVDMLIKRGHESVLEHANIIIQMDEKTARDIALSMINFDDNFMSPIYLRCTATYDRWIISGNVRAWRDYFRLANASKIPHKIIAFFRHHSFHKLWDDVLSVFAPCKDYT